MGSLKSTVIGLGTAVLAGVFLTWPVGQARGEVWKPVHLPWVARPPRPPVVTIAQPPADVTVTSYVTEIRGSIVSAHLLTADPTALVVGAGSQQVLIRLQPDGSGGFAQPVPLFAGLNRVTVTATSAQGEGRSERSITCALPAAELQILLDWDTLADLDLHLVRPGGLYMAVPDDCFWLNGHPDWGTPGDEGDDPQLLIEDRDGYGPECIVLPRPEPGSYTVYVHHYPGSGAEPPARAALRIWFRGAEYAMGPFDVAEGEEIGLVVTVLEAGSPPAQTLQWRLLAP